MFCAGNELSGGQKRKLSVAIAVCGGSKFVVLDEVGCDHLHMVVLLLFTIYRLFYAHSPRQAWTP
ncbi:ATP-binding cassette domain-containing protein [archaeon]|nr:MAG: ATP-binding cassette domain-containing protein [archaeon]